MSDQVENQPAFPCPAGYARVKEYHPGHGEFEKTVAICEKGMTLRDWFAGQALAGLCAQNSDSPETRAMECYAYADAFLKERAK